MTVKKKEKCVLKKLVSIFISTIRHVMTKGCIVLKTAHNKRKQEMTEKGANDMNYMKTWKLNIVWISIPYEQSSIRDCQPNIAPAPKYNKMPGVAIGTVGQGVQSKVKGIKVAKRIPIHVYSTDKRKYHFLKQRSDICENVKWTEIQSNNKLALF